MMNERRWLDKLRQWVSDFLELLRVGYAVLAFGYGVKLAVLYVDPLLQPAVSQDSENWLWSHFDEDTVALLALIGSLAVLVWIGSKGWEWLRRVYSLPKPRWQAPVYPIVMTVVVATWIVGCAALTSVRADKVFQQWFVIMGHWMAFSGRKMPMVLLGLVLVLIVTALIEAIQQVIQWHQNDEQDEGADAD